MNVFYHIYGPGTRADNSPMSKLLYEHKHSINCSFVARFFHSMTFKQFPYVNARDTKFDLAAK